MATIVLGVAGNLIAPGYGGAIGAAVGAYIDQAVITELTKEDIPPIEYGTIQAQGAEGGASFWRAHGRRARVIGNILFVGNYRSRTTGGSDRFGKRGEPATITNYLDVAVGMSRHLPGKFSRFERVFVDGKLLHDARPTLDSPHSYLGDGFAQSTRLRVGASFVFVQHLEPVWPENSEDFRPALVDEPLIDRQLSIASSAQVRSRRINPLSVVYTADLQEPHGIPVGATRLVQMRPSTLPGGIADQFRWWQVARSVSSTEISFPVFIDTMRVNPQYPVDVAIGGIERFCPVSVFDGFQVSDAPVQIVDPIFETFYIEFDEIEAAGRYVNDLKFLQLGNVTRSLDPEWLYRYLRFFMVRATRQEWNTSMLERGAENVEFPHDVSRLAGGEGTSDQSPPSRLVTVEGSSIVPGFRDTSVISIEEMNLSTTYGRLGNFDAILECNDVDLGDVLQSVCEFHGIDPADCDVSAISGDCEGFAYPGVTTGLQALAPLMAAYDIFAQENGAGVVWKHYENASTFNIAEDFWLEDGNGRTFEITDQGQERAVRTVTLSYRSAEEDLIWKQAVDVNPRTVGGGDEQVRLNVAMTRDQAEDVARRIGRRIRASRLRARGRLPRAFQQIQEGDVIATTFLGESVTFRVSRAELALDGSLVVEGDTEVR